MEFAMCCDREDFRDCLEVLFNQYGKTLHSEGTRLKLGDGPKNGPQSKKLAQQQCTGPTQRRDKREVRGWFWVRKNLTLQPQLGFPMSTAEVRRFGWKVKKIVRAEERLCDSRSFVEVVKGEMMYHNQNCLAGRDGEGRNQQRQFDGHGGNFRGGQNQCF
jgi:hypothetical protein